MRPNVASKLGFPHQISWSFCERCSTQICLSYDLVCFPSWLCCNHDSYVHTDLTVTSSWSVIVTPTRENKLEGETMIYSVYDRSLYCMFDQRRKVLDADRLTHSWNGKGKQLYWYLSLSWQFKCKLWAIGQAYQDSLLRPNHWETKLIRRVECTLCWLYFDKKVQRESQKFMLVSALFSNIIKNTKFVRIRVHKFANSVSKELTRGP
jgi:hypothetical protein